MERIVCISSNGYTIEIGNGFPYFLEEISGIHEVSGDIATVKSAFGIGSKYMGTSVDDRNITITGYLKVGYKLEYHKEIHYIKLFL